MSAIQVDRYTFTVDEVVAAILPNVGRHDELELRVDAYGYVVIDIVHPYNHGAMPGTAPLEASQDPALDDFPGDRQQQAATPPPTPAPAREQDHSQESGPREEEARSLCRATLFRAFLEVKTEEAAMRTLAHRCHVQQLSDLDRTRSNGMNLRHVIEEFEAWKIM